VSSPDGIASGKAVQDEGSENASRRPSHHPRQPLRQCRRPADGVGWHHSLL